MDPASLITGAASVIGNLFGLGISQQNASAQANLNKQNLVAQQHENNINRVYNLQVAREARKASMDFTREMYERQYNDNSYSSQVAQMKAAGINPALAYSSGNFSGASPLSASSPTASSSGSVSPNSRAGVVDPQFAANLALTAAQTANINAQTKKINAETEGQYSTNELLKSDAKFRDALNQGQINLNGIEIDLKGSAKDLNDEQITNLRKHYALLDADIKKTLLDCDLVKAEIDSLGEDVIAKRIENSFKSEHMRAIIDNIKANTDLSRAQIETIFKKLPFEIAKLGSETALNNAMQAVQVALKDNVKADTDVKKGTRNLQAWDSYIKAEQVQTQKAVTRSTNASASFTEYDTDYTFQPSDPLRCLTLGVRSTIAAFRGSR